MNVSQLYLLYTVSAVVGLSAIAIYIRSKRKQKNIRFDRSLISKLNSGTSPVVMFDIDSNKLNWANDTANKLLDIKVGDSFKLEENTYYDKALDERIYKGAGDYSVELSEVTTAQGISSLVFFSKKNFHALKEKERIEKESIINLAQSDLDSIKDTYKTIFEDSQIDFNLDTEMTNLYKFDDLQKEKLENIIEFSYELAYAQLSTKVAISIINEDISVVISDVEKSELPFLDNVYHSHGMDQGQGDKLVSSWKNVEDNLNNQLLRFEIFDTSSGLELSFSKFKSKQVQTNNSASL